MKIVLMGVLVNTDEYKDQLIKAFNNEFGEGFELLGYYKTLPGNEGPGGRSDVVIEMPNKYVGKAAIHAWHLGGLFRWYDDYYNNNKSIIPAKAQEELFADLLNGQ